jgi:hypothetical protein
VEDLKEMLKGRCFLGFDKVPNRIVDCIFESCDVVVEVV